MVDTAQFEQFKVFMRKIGFSVGLENTFARLNDLVELYIREGDVTPTGWSQLVHDKWGLKNQHIRDVFVALKYLDRRGGKVFVGPKLDTLAIVKTVLHEMERPSDKGAKFVFAHSIIEADGEIFLNCLASEFDNEKVRERLTELCEFKRKILFEIFKVPSIRQKLSQIVTIDHQPTNIGGAGGGEALSEQKRREALSKRTEPLSFVSDTHINISDDYLQKVPPKRKEWAKTLGLCDGLGLLTDIGRVFLKCFADAGCLTPNDGFVIWPLEHEIIKLRLQPKWLGSQNPLGIWELSEIIFRGLGSGKLLVKYQKTDHTWVIDELFRYFEIYRSLYRKKAMLRRELPYSCAVVVFAAISYALDRELPPVDLIISKERSGEARRIELRSSRISGGALSFRR